MLEMLHTVSNKLGEDSWWLVAIIYKIIISKSKEFMLWLILEEIQIHKMKVFKLNNLLLLWTRWKWQTVTSWWWKIILLNNHEMHTGLWLIFPKHFSDLTYLLCISFQKLCNQASYVCTVLIWDGWVGPSIGKHNTQALPEWKFGALGKVASDRTGHQIIMY